MPYGTKLNLAAGGFDEPENGEKSTDGGGARYRAHIGGLGKRGPADIARKLDTVAVVGGEVLKVISRRADPELVGLLVDDIGRRHPVGGWLPHIRFGNQLIAACVSEHRRPRKDHKGDTYCPEPHGSLPSRRHCANFSVSAAIG